VHLAAVGAEGLVMVEAALKQGDELAVDLHGIEVVAGLQMAQDGGSDRASARAHLQDTRGTARLAQLRNEGARQEATAREDGPGRLKFPATFAEEVPAQPPVAHPSGLVNGTPAHAAVSRPRM
jgi:hypothetical protein